MAYSFKNISISIFDIHPSVLMLDSSKPYVQDSFVFLKSAAKYNQQYLGNQQVETSNFIFRGLPDYDLKNHFWGSLARIRQQGGKPDFWGLQLPFVSKFKSAVELTHGMKNVTVTVTPSVYLSGLGWSVNLKINIRGDINTAELIDLIGWLSTGGRGPFSFKIGPELMDRKYCFRKLNGLMLNEVYVQGNNPQPDMSNMNYFVISINSYDGDILPCNSIPSYEDALLRSILYGRKIELSGLQNEKKNYPTVTTQITNDKSNFALTQFDQRTLIFLQREANTLNAVNKENKRKVMCFVENCKNFLRMSYLLLRFHSESEIMNGNNDLAHVRAGIPQTLGFIPKVYKSAFCTNLFLQHNQFAKFK